MLILLPLWFYTAWRAVKGSALRPKSLLWLIIPAAPLVEWTRPGFYATVFVLLPIVSCCIGALSILKAPAPNKVRGGVFGRREQLMAAFGLGDAF